MLYNLNEGNKKMKKIGVLGSGTWGMALARMLYRLGNEVQVWSVDFSDIIQQSDGTSMHKNLPNIIIPKGIEYTDSLKELCNDKDIILVVVASMYVRETIRKASSFIKDDQIVVDFAKGIESETQKTMSEVIRDELKSDSKIVVMSGPSHAEEVAKDLPTTIVAASDDIVAAKTIQNIFSSDTLRVYTNMDIKGVEICGALKNIVALAAGISAGLGYGDNAKAAIITRGMSEIASLGEKMGCVKETFSGLAGIGDMIVTATSVHSRNNKCGFMIGQGIPVKTAIEKVGMVVEGIYALPAAIKLAELYHVEMPIIRAVNDIINNKANPLAISVQLMGRDKKPENNIGVYDARYEKAIINNIREIGRGGNNMKRVITYGTFDLLHYGHINLLKRAKALGDYLIVVISTDEFNWNEKHKKCYFSYEQRKALVEALRYVDLVIPEESWNQKRSDMHEYHVDTFVIGDDWQGKFDFLKEEGVEVVYLPRTPEISSSQIKKDLNVSGDVGESKTEHSDINTDPKK